MCGSSSPISADQWLSLPEEARHATNRGDAAILPLVNVANGHVGFAASNVTLTTRVPRMKSLGINLPRTILYVVLVMVVAGFVMHGLRPAAFWENVLARPRQSLALRFILQPAMATILALRDGITDARSGHMLDGRTMISDPAKRFARLREGIEAIGKIFLIAIAIDIGYQAIELNAFYPSEALVVAVLLAFIPYLIVRPLAARLVRRWLRGKVAEPRA
jgi:hypothetical protein